MECTLFLAARDATFDGGAVTIQTVFSHALADNAPIDVKLAFVAGVVAYPHEFGKEVRLTYRVTDEDGNIVSETFSKFKITAKKRDRIFHSHQIHITVVTLPKFCIYEFSLSIDNEVKATFPLELKEANKPPIGLG